MSPSSSFAAVCVVVATLVVIASMRPRVFRGWVLSAGFWYLPVMKVFSTSRAICTSCFSICHASSAAGMMVEPTVTAGWPPVARWRVAPCRV